MLKESRSELSFDVDLRMPKTCSECVYSCCRPPELRYKCGRGLWSDDYCTGDCVPIARSYPLSYNTLTKKFEVDNCQGFIKGLKPFELIEVVEGG